MSTEYFFCCHAHSVDIWSGTDGLARWQFPYKNENFMKKLSSFLDEHKSCGIEFLSEHEIDDKRDGMKEIEVIWDTTTPDTSPETDAPK